MRAKLDKLTGNLRESDLPSGVDLLAMQQQAHRHDNKSVLDKIGEADGKLLFDGEAVTAAAEVATQTANGLMSKEDKTKLDGLGGVATQTANGLMSKEDKAKLDGLGGVATQSANGLMSKEDKAKLDGLDSVATQTANGLMSKEDKTKLDGISRDFFGDSPFLEFKDAGSLLLKSGTALSVGDVEYSATADVELDVADLLDTGTIQAGKDYCVYITTDQTFVVSLNSTFPSGTLSDGSTAFSAENTRKIGGFHTLCVAAGEISGHPLSGFSAGDILPASVWCLNHRPYCEPAGMVYCEALDFWVDIYLQSGTGEATESVFGGTITHTRYQPDHTEDMFSVRKKLLSDEEFSAAAAGSNKKTAFPGGTPPETSGGHVDSAGRRMISDIGCEDCCGMIWHSLRDLGTWGLGESNTWKTLSGNAGDYYGEVNILLAGGACNDPSNNAAHCGPRARNGINGLSCLAVMVSARGMSPNRISTEG